MKFWMMRTRYLKQRGQSEASYVVASPATPALIDMDDGFKPSVDMVPAEDEPGKLRPAHAGHVPEAPRTNAARMGTRLADL